VAVDYAARETKRVGEASWRQWS